MQLLDWSLCKQMTDERVFDAQWLSASNQMFHSPLWSSSPMHISRCVCVYVCVAKKVQFMLISLLCCLYTFKWKNLCSIIPFQYGIWFQDSLLSWLTKARSVIVWKSSSLLRKMFHSRIIKLFRAFLLFWLLCMQVQRFVFFLIFETPWSVSYPFVADFVHK